MSEKVMSLTEFVAAVPAGAQLAFGGGGLQRKPMVATAALSQGHGAYDVVSLLAGPEVDLMIGLGRVSRLSFAYVGFDAMGLAPNFRAARQEGALEVVEYSEATLMAAFEAGAKRLPFIPTRFGLGTDILTTRGSPLKEFACPLTGAPLVAVPAINPDVAILHVNLADRHGNAVIYGDGFFDGLIARASGATYLTAERVVDRLPDDLPANCTVLSRLWTAGVIECPNGGCMSTVYPDYLYDLNAVRDYQKNATRPEWLAQFAQELAS